MRAAEFRQPSKFVAAPLDFDPSFDDVAKIGRGAIFGPFGGDRSRMHARAVSGRNKRPGASCTQGPGGQAAHRPLQPPGVPVLLPPRARVRAASLPPLLLPAPGAHQEP